MTDLTIDCPHCRKSFKLNETLAAPLLDATRREFEREYQGKEEALKKRERDIALQETEKARKKFEEEGAERDRQRWQLEEELKLLRPKVADAQKAETDYLRKQRELDVKLREAELTAEKRANELVAPLLEKARKDAEDSVRLKITEKDKVIEDQKKQLAEAQRKLEQGSQQLQGEVLELDLERRLREAFPRDTIEPVQKGRHGGDAVHQVLSPRGQVSGMILWESKRTKNWSGGWPDKLKQDQRAARADLAVIVTQAMPAGIDAFGEVEGVWVTTPALAMPLAAVLRLALSEAFDARRAAEGQQDKMAILYQYLTGPQFRQRVEAIKDAFTAMQADLDAEKRVITKQWAKRQQQIERVMASTVGMYGDLQGIAGTALTRIDGLELDSLGPGSRRRDD